MARRKVAIVGAAGFIGTNLFDHLAHEVPRTIDRNPADHIQQVIDVERDIPEFKGCRAVVCCASTAHVWGQPIADIYHESRIVARMMYLAEEAGVETFIHLSSSSVYGEHRSFYSEKDECIPKSAYGKQKLYAERVLREWHLGEWQGSQMRAVSIRVFNALGKYQRRTMLPYVLVENSLNGKPTTIYTNSFRSWTPVTDVCKFIAHVVDQSDFKRGSHTILNCGNPNPTPHEEMIYLIKLLMERRGLPTPEVRYVDHLRPGEAGGYSCDMSVTKRRLPYLPAFTLDIESALEDVIDTVLDNMRVEFQTPRLMARHDPVRAY